MIKAAPFSVAFAVVSFLLSAGTTLADNITEIIGNPIPQYNGKTCQSYSAAVLLAFQNDPAFPINTLSSLRDAELGIRHGIEQSAKGGEPSHTDIIAGVESYTSGLYTLKEETLSGVDQLGDYIGSKTGLTSVVPFPIASTVVQTPLMISVTRIGGNKYGGHLVTVLGVSGPPSSDRQYLIVNSAVKTGDGVKLFCDPNEPDSQTTYGALTSWTNDIDFKDYGGQTYYAFYLVKK